MAGLVGDPSAKSVANCLAVYVKQNTNSLDNLDSPLCERPFGSNSGGKATN